MLLPRDVKRFVLPNGLTLLVRHDVTAPVVAIVTHVRAGYFDESDNVVGISHVLEHMYFKGTVTRGVGEIARETKAAGGYLNAHTIYDHTSYFTVLPARSFVKGLEIQFDAYANSVIDENELERELEVIVQETKRKRDTPTAVAIESLYALLYDKHRIRRWRIGNEDALRTFTRAQVNAFYRNWYTPSNTILSVVGDVHPDIVVKEVASRYGTLSQGSPRHSPGEGEIAEPTFRVREWAGDIAHQHTVFGWRTPSFAHTDTAALDVAAVAIGSGRASRLYKAVRDKQLASSVSAWNFTARDVGVFAVSCDGPSVTASVAAKSAWDEVIAVCNDKLAQREIVRAQRIMEARWLRRMESADGQATMFAMWEAEGGLSLAEDYAEQIMSLSAEDVRDAMQRHIRPLQASIISYRPNLSLPLGESSEQIRELLSSSLPVANNVGEVSESTCANSSSEQRAPAISHSVAEEQHVNGIKVYRTRNGIPVVVFRRHGAPLVHLGVFQRGGASLESTQQEGLVRLMVQSTLKGAGRRTGSEIAEAIEELGSAISVGASLDSLSWSLSVPAKYLSDASGILADVVQRPAFLNDSVEVERQLAIAELTKSRDDMYRWPMRLAYRAAFGEHPYARSVQGNEHSLSSLSVGDISSFHADKVMTGATVVCITGDVNESDAAAILARDFSALSWGEDEAPSRAIRQAPTTIAENRERKQTAIALLYGGASRNDNSRFAALVLAAIASGLGGRFFEQLRDRQSLAYSVLAAPVARRSGGAFAAYIATSPEREDEARNGLLMEFGKFVDKEPSGEEMDRAIQHLIGNRELAQQSGATVLGDLADAWLFGSLQELQTFAGSIESVTSKDVLNFAREHFYGTLPSEGIVRGVKG